MQRRNLPLAMRLIVCALFLLVVGDLAAQESVVRVFRPDGSLQCGMGQARSLAEDQKLLEPLGARVITGEKKMVPVVIALCGAPTGRANTFEISASDWEKVRRGFVGPVEFALWLFESKSVLVYKYD